LTNFQSHYNPGIGRCQSRDYGIREFGWDYIYGIPGLQSLPVCVCICVIVLIQPLTANSQ